MEAAYRPSWFKQVKRSLRGCRFKPTHFGLMQMENEMFLDLFGFLIVLPFFSRYLKPSEFGEEPQWRVYTMDGHSLWLWWGRWHKVFYAPWSLEYIKTDTRRADGTWVKRVACYDKGEPDVREVKVLPYRYILKSGEVQDRTATVHVERWEWRWRWVQFASVPGFRKIRTSLEIEFSDEVGERSGSWKGGCIGCGYEMNPGESMEQTLRRMERERKF